VYKKRVSFFEIIFEVRAARVRSGRLAANTKIAGSCGTFAIANGCDKKEQMHAAEQTAGGSRKKILPETG
jgi:hypothetical protein